MSFGSAIHVDGRRQRIFTVALLWCLLSISAVSDAAGTKLGKGAPTGANAFLTFRITDAKTVAQVSLAQQQMVKKDERFNATLQSLHSLHITLHILQINDTNIEAARAALDEAADKISLAKKTFSADFNGTSDFGRTILIGKLTHDSRDQMTLLYRITLNSFLSHGIRSLSRYRYHPHMTILQLPKHSEETAGMKDEIKAMEAKLVLDGKQVVGELLLCQMGLRPGASFYDVLYAKRLPTVL